MTKLFANVAISLLSCSLMASVAQAYFPEHLGTLQDALYGTDIRVVDDQQGTSLLLSADFLFQQAGSPIIARDYYEQLERVINILSVYSDVPLMVTGHTDTIFSDPKRYQVSFMYANSVANYLIMRGIAPQRLRKVSGEGALWPIANNNAYAGRHLNRRVEITLLGNIP